MREVDVVVVSYNSRDRLRACVEPLLELPDVNVIVVDNASPDGSLDAVGDLPLTAIQLPATAVSRTASTPAGGRARRRTSCSSTRTRDIDGRSLEALVGCGRREARRRRGRTAHRPHGRLARLLAASLPALRSTYAQALFLHRLFPTARWTDELVRDEAAYAGAVCPTGSPAPACSCAGRRSRSSAASTKASSCTARTSISAGGSGRPATSSLYEPRRARRARGRRVGTARVAPARARREPPPLRGEAPRPHVALLERIGVALGAVTHAALGRGGATARAGHLRALRPALTQPTQS